MLEDVSLTLRRGEVVGLVGAERQREDDAREDRVRTARAERRARRAHGARRRISPRIPGRYLACERCDEEVALGASSRAAAEHALEAVGLRGYEARHPRDLSSGERERLALAAVLATRAGRRSSSTSRPAASTRTHADGSSTSSRAGRDDRATLLVTHDDELVAALADRAVSLGDEGARLAA